MPTSENDHVTKKVLYPFDNKFVQIDEGLVEFMKALWKAGFKTDFSCEDWEKGGTHFSFISTPSVIEKFIMRMRKSDDAILSTYFNLTIWDEKNGKNESKNQRNLTYMHTWIPGYMTHPGSAIRTNLYIPIVLKDLITSELGK